MKKLLIVLVASFFVFQVAEAQIFKYGIKAGIGFSSLKISDVTGINDGNDVYDLVTGDAVMGYHFGVQTRIKVAMIYVQPELYFNSGGGTVEQVYENGASEMLNVNFSTIDVPVLVGVKLGPVRLNLGPVGSFVLNEENELGSIQEDYSIFTNAMTWGYQAGLGVGISKISLDLRYEGSLQKLGETLTVGGNNFVLDARPRQIIVSLGVWF
ncbi:MAG: porin family protein [Bacteroidota bacterium]